MTEPSKPYARQEPDGRAVWVGGQPGDNLPRLPHRWPAQWPDVRWLSRGEVEQLLNDQS